MQRRPYSDRRAMMTSGSPVTPLKLFGASLAQWYDRRYGITLGTPPEVAAWADQSTKGNALSQGTASLRPSYSGGLVEFDGIDDYIVATDNASLDFVTAFTIGFACRFDTLASIQVVASKGAAGADNAWTFQMDTSNLRCLIDGIVNLGYVAPASAGTWARYIFVFNGAGVGNAQRLRAWKNGVEGITHTGTIPASITNGGTQNVALGRWAGSAFQYLDGSISAFASTGIVATDAQVLLLDRYLAGSVP